MTEFERFKSSRQKVWQRLLKPRNHIHKLPPVTGFIGFSSYLDGAHFPASLTCARFIFSFSMFCWCRGERPREIPFCTRSQSISNSRLTVLNHMRPLEFADLHLLRVLMRRAQSWLDSKESPRKFSSFDLESGSNSEEFPSSFLSSQLFLRRASFGCAVVVKPM